MCSFLLLVMYSSNSASWGRLTLASAISLHSSEAKIVKSFFLAALNKQATACFARLIYGNLSMFLLRLSQISIALRVLASALRSLTLSVSNSSISCSCWVNLSPVYTHDTPTVAVYLLESFTFWGSFAFGVLLQSCLNDWWSFSD